MGTSARYPGASPTNPLIPSWLGTAPNEPPAPLPNESPIPSQDPKTPPNQVPSSPQKPGSPDPGKPSPQKAAISQGDPNRFRTARTSFNQGARTGDSGRIRKALSSYVRKGMGGSRTAAARMVHSSRAAGKILAFAEAVRKQGFDEAAKAFGIGDLSGKSLDEALTRLTETFCEPGGGIDEGITRRAWDEALLNAIENGITDFDGITDPQIWKGMTEFFIAESVVLRIINDVGNKLLSLAADVSAINRMQTEIREVVICSVRASITPLLGTGAHQSQTEWSAEIKSIYETAFAYLEALNSEED